MVIFKVKTTVSDWSEICFRCTKFKTHYSHFFDPLDVLPQTYFVEKNTIVYLIKIVYLFTLAI